MALTRHEPWRSRIADIRYPFTDGATLRGRDGLDLPSDLLIDAVLHPPREISGIARLGRVAVMGDEVKLVFMEDRNILGSARYSRDQPPDETLTVTDNLNRHIGTLVVSPASAASLAAWPAGEHRFDEQAAALSPTVLIPASAPGVGAMADGQGQSVPVEVYLVAEDGVQLAWDDGLVRVHAVGDPLFLRKSCIDHFPEADFPSGPYLRTINGQPPDNTGHFQVTVNEADSAEDTVLRFRPQSGGLRVELTATRGV